jgi:hypothetical protein
MALLLAGAGNLLAGQLNPGGGGTTLNSFWGPAAEGCPGSKEEALKGGTAAATVLVREADGSLKPGGGRSFEAGLEPPSEGTTLACCACCRKGMTRGAGLGPAACTACLSACCTATVPARVLSLACGFPAAKPFGATLDTAAAADSAAAAAAAALPP